MKRTRDIAGLLGLACITAGIACYDWRAALIVCGGVAFVGSIIGSILGGKNAR